MYQRNALDWCDKLQQVLDFYRDSLPSATKCSWVTQNAETAEVSRVVKLTRSDCGLVVKLTRSDCDRVVACRQALFDLLKIYALWNTRSFSCWLLSWGDGLVSVGVRLIRILFSRVTLKPAAASSKWQWTVTNCHKLDASRMFSEIALLVHVVGVELLN